ncbi:hypothetical protein [Fodinibius salicampi]|nr:hypothetical protein [Fodinibius salicampi]
MKAIYVWMPTFEQNISHNLAGKDNDMNWGKISGMIAFEKEIG